MIPEIQRKNKNKQMKNIVEFHNQTKSEIMTVSMIDEDLQKARLFKSFQRFYQMSL